MRHVTSQAPKRQVFLEQGNEGISHTSKYLHHLFSPQLPGLPADRSTSHTRSRALQLDILPTPEASLVASDKQCHTPKLLLKDQNNLLKTYDFLMSFDILSSQI